MIKSNDLMSLIGSDILVKQPINEISEMLKKSIVKKTILYGQRGSGRTTVLKNHQYRNVGTENPAIYVRFDSVGLFNNNLEGLEADFDKEFITYFYELSMANKILNFIKTNYENLFNKHFKKDKEQIEKLGEEINEYIRNYYYKEISLNNNMMIGELTIGYIEKLKKFTELNSLTLMIDRFDWTDNNSIIAQYILKEYFNIFDKSIITTDDEQLVNNESARLPLIEQGFDFVETNYVKDIDILKIIITSRIEKYNLKISKLKKFPIDVLTDKVFAKLIKKTNGNINVILNSINEMVSIWQWENDFNKEFNFIESIDYCINKQLEQVKSLKKLLSPIKLFSSTTR